MDNFLWWFLGVVGSVAVLLIIYVVILYLGDREFWKERDRWIAQYGDDHIKNAIRHGYDCCDCYVRLRATQELGGAWGIEKTTRYYPPCGCPTEEALRIVDSLTAKNVFPRIYRVNDNEAIVLYGYLGRYTIIRYV